MTPLDELFIYPPPRSLEEFKEIWLHCFVYALISSLIVHSIAAIIGVARLRKHPWGRFIPIVIIVIGVITPLTFGAFTCAAIAGIYKAAELKMPPIYSLVWGFAQTTVVVFLSFTRFLFTL